jgi:hypothetical protein
VELQWAEPSRLAAALLARAQSAAAAPRDFCDRAPHTWSARFVRTRRSRSRRSVPGRSRARGAPLATCTSRPTAPPHSKTSPPSPISPSGRSPSHRTTSYPSADRSPSRSRGHNRRTQGRPRPPSRPPRLHRPPRHSSSKAAQRLPAPTSCSADRCLGTNPCANASTQRTKPRPARRQPFPEALCQSRCQPRHAARIRRHPYGPPTRSRKAVFELPQRRETNPPYLLDSVASVTMFPLQLTRGGAAW